MAIGEDDLKRDDKLKPQYNVWVYQMVEGKWVEQADRKLVTADVEQARKYTADVKKVAGWIAISNAIEPVRRAESNPLVGKWLASFGDFLAHDPPGTHRNIMLLFDDGTGVLSFWVKSKEVQSSAIEWKGNTKGLLFCDFGKSFNNAGNVRLWEFENQNFDNGQLVEFTPKIAGHVYKRQPESKK
jgi:hypothetical protein